MKLRSKQLLSLWDKHSYSTQKKTTQKPIDGQFIFQSLFSVDAFASKKNVSMDTQLSQHISEKLLLKLRKLRDSLNDQHRELKNSIDSSDINLNASEALPVDIEINERSYTPCNVMLIKVFLACDRYFETLYQGRLNGELTQKEMQQKRKVAVNQISQCLYEINRTCISFHKVRKEAKATA